MDHMNIYLIKKERPKEPKLWEKLKIQRLVCNKTIRTNDIEWWPDMQGALHKVT